MALDPVHLGAISAYLHVLCANAFLLLLTNIHYEDYLFQSGVHVWTAGPHRPILKAQASYGFGNVCEAALQSLLGDKCPSAASSQEGDRKLELQMAAIAKFEPEWTDSEATAALQHGSLRGVSLGPAPLALDRAPSGFADPAQ